MGEHQIPENLFKEHHGMSCYDRETTSEYGGRIAVGTAAGKSLGYGVLWVADQVADTEAWVVMEPATVQELFRDYCLVATNDNGGQSVVSVWHWGQITLSRPAGSTGIEVKVESEGHDTTTVVIGGDRMHFLWYDLGWLASEVPA